MKSNRINRIEYIVRGNPLEAEKLLFNAGFEVPDNEDDLVEAMKEWIQLEGKKAIIQLIQIHPEHDLIANQEEPNKGCSCGGNCNGGNHHSFSAGCGCHHGFNGDNTLASLKEELSGLSKQDLKGRLAELEQLVDLNPEDAELKEELEVTWGMIKKRFANRKKASKSTQVDDDYLLKLTKSDVGFGVLVLGLAFLVSRI